ncbi:hypothetical protein KXQ82_00820 [Mucilaginibacter sp. HMF5004]|uniref:YfcC family protein n=1 Tax=Mucilaginibacter rivuli TaxID=2857527 RepID=UPI001C5D9E31|nr:hypothetical protein [Mucilaginibacter rivuli]MBW4888230.1 hypothetical protein [Mucilaginibacter rivuli]
MPLIKKLPAPLTILLIVIIISALTTWLLPPGEYNKLSYSDNVFSLNTPKGTLSLRATQHTLDSLNVRIPLIKFKSGDIRKPVAVPGTYHQLHPNKQGAVKVMQAPIKGLTDTADIIFFILIIGGFMMVFQETGAMEQGIKYLSYKMKGREAWLIISLTFFFSFCGSSYGMAEEALVFYPVLVPLYLAAGYDLLVPVAVIFAGTQLGTLSSFSDPFSVIIASNAAGINWTDGLLERMVIFFITTIVTIAYIVRYANMCKKDPTKSLVYRFDRGNSSPYSAIVHNDVNSQTTLSSRNIGLLCLFFVTLFGMIAGVIWLGWWMTEMSAIFLAAAILVAFLVRMNEKVFLERFIRGAQDLISVAFIIGVARGITIILNDGHISDSILFYSAQMVGGMPPMLFIIVLFLLYGVFTLFISSSSGMAVLTMPIFGSLAAVVGVPGREIVNCYLFGMGVMGFITPNGLILPSLALVNVSLKTWIRFIGPLLLILTAICAAFLVIGVLMK